MSIPSSDSCWPVKEVGNTEGNGRRLRATNVL